MLEAPASPQQSYKRLESRTAGKTKYGRPTSRCETQMLRHLTFAFLRLKSSSSSVKNCLSRFSQEEDGQAITEYIMILSISLVTAIALGRGIVKMFDKGILKLGAQLEKDLKTGRAPLSVWKN